MAPKVVIHKFVKFVFFTFIYYFIVSFVALNEKFEITTDDFNKFHCIFVGTLTLKKLCSYDMFFKLSQKHIKIYSQKSLVKTPFIIHKLPYANRTNGEKPSMHNYNQMIQVPS